MYHSQVGQDEFVDNFLGGKRNGRYLDIGSHNGVDLSNSYFFEVQRGWTGVLIEPMEEEYAKLVANRSDKNDFFNVAVSNYFGTAQFTKILGGYHGLNMISGLKQSLHEKHLDRIHREANESNAQVVDVTVSVRTVQDILDECELYQFDFCSLDTEGSEYEVLQGIDFSKTEISIFLIENNGYESREKIESFLSRKGYRFHRSIGHDDVYTLIH
jgi:FkbM family methyltransferase